MRCAWQEFINVLPKWMRQDVDRLGRDTMQELRLRADLMPELVCTCGSHYLDRTVQSDDLNYVVNAASRYSPWNAATAAQGYITAPGGHRIGLCGDAVVRDGQLQGIREVRSLCLRVARDFPGLAQPLPRTGSILLIGPPGAGKTTLLRDLIRQRSQYQSVAVVDERGELFPPGLETGQRTDVMTGCSKPEGIDAVLRTMSPGCIAVDEITSETDCLALTKAGWCGVELLATAHAANRADLDARPIYTNLVHSGLFDTLIVLQRDKSWQAERM